MRRSWGGLEMVLKWTGRPGAVLWWSCDGHGMVLIWSWDGPGVVLRWARGGRVCPGSPGRWSGDGLLSIEKKYILLSVERIRLLVIEKRATLSSAKRMSLSLSSL